MSSIHAACFGRRSTGRRTASAPTEREQSRQNGRAHCQLRGVSPFPWSFDHVKLTALACVHSIDKEQALRDSVKPSYGAFEGRRLEARESATIPSAPFDPSSVSFDLLLAVPTSLEEALALGRTILAGEPATKAKGKKAKGKGKEPVDELSSTLAEVRLEVSAAL